MKKKKVVALSAALVMLSTMFTGFSSSSVMAAAKVSVPQAAIPKDSAKAIIQQIPKMSPYKMSVMMPYGTNENDDDPLKNRYYKAIEKYTNTSIEFIWYDLNMYYEKLTLIFASGDIPTLLTTGKSAEFINACANGAFWDVTDYIDLFPNLQYMDPVAGTNASINGRLFGVPRSRAVGRNGFGYRQDWLDNLGMDQPETIDDLYEMLVAFTTKDPDMNGKDDTYGLGISNYAGSWDIMQIWFGVPNKWGISDKDELVPDFLTPEYDEALKWFRKIYSEGLVNPDFNTYPSGQWDNLLRGGIAGASADVTDRFRRNQEYFDRENIPAETTIVGSFKGKKGSRTLPTLGYADVLAINKTKSKTAEDMLRVMYFIDKMSDAEMLNLTEWGYIGDDYYFDAKLGYNIRYTADQKKANGFPTTDFRNGLNQMLNYFISPEQEALRNKAEPLSALRVMEAAVQAENLKYAIPNYGAPYVSETYAKVGADLDTMIAEARINYIIGVIDDVGLQEVKNQWKRSGGDNVIKEMNALYKASKR